MVVTSSRKAAVCYKLAFDLAVQPPADILAEVLNDDLHLLRDVGGVQLDPIHHRLDRRALIHQVGAGAAGDLDGSRGGGVQSTEVVEKVFIAEHGGQRSQASML